MLNMYIFYQGVRMIVTDDLDDAANKAVNIVDILNKAELVHLDVNFASL